MKRTYTTQFIARTALLLALCVVVQQFKSASQFITGPLVNLILIIAALAVGLWSGVAIAVLSPIMAALINPAPIMKLVPQLVPMIIVGNVIIVLLVWAFREKKLVVGLALGSAAKAGFLALCINFLIVPLFGAALSDMQRTVVIGMFSYNQLITAVIASVIVMVVWPRLKRSPSFVLRK